MGIWKESSARVHERWRRIITRTAARNHVLERDIYSDDVPQLEFGREDPVEAEKRIIAEGIQNAEDQVLREERIEKNLSNLHTDIERLVLPRERMFADLATRKHIPEKRIKPA